MSKIRHLCLGVSALSLLFLGIFSVQIDASASSTCRNPHQIAEGENLTVIAAAYNVTVDALIEENGITDANVIVIGQTICIPNGAKKSSNSGNGDEYTPRYNEDWGSYGVPGESYDPATISRGGGSSPQYGNSPQQESYAPQQESYAPHEESYGPPENSYGPQEESYGPPQESHSSYGGVPGKAYDPAVIYAPQPQAYPTRSTADREFDEEFEEEPTPTEEATPPGENGQEVILNP